MPPVMATDRAVAVSAPGAGLLLRGLASRSSARGLWLEVAVDVRRLDVDRARPPRAPRALRQPPRQVRQPRQTRPPPRRPREPPARRPEPPARRPEPPARRPRTSGSVDRSLGLADRSLVRAPRLRLALDDLGPRLPGTAGPARTITPPIGGRTSSVVSTRFSDSESRRRSASISMILIVTTSPCETISRGFSTWCWASSEMWTSPSTPGRISTKAPKVTTFVTRPWTTSPSW